MAWQHAIDAVNAAHAHGHNAAIANLGNGQLVVMEYDLRSGQHPTTTRDQTHLAIAAIAYCHRNAHNAKDQP
jgi:hypothetical protein